MNKKEMEFHKLANVFPLMKGEAFEQFVKDIRKNGIIEPIVLYEEKILDGRNRYRACIKASIDPIYRVFNSNIDPLDYIISKNLKRRQLTPAQKAESVDKIIGYKNLRIVDNKIKNEGKEVKIIMKDLGVQEKTIIQTHMIKEVIKPKNLKTKMKITPIKGKEKEIEITPERVKKTKKAWDNALKGNKSIKEVYQIATDTEKEKVLRKSYKNFYSDVKKDYSELMVNYKLLEKRYEIIKQVCTKRGIWDDIFKEAFPVVEKEKSYEPTIKEMRKAELI